MRYKKYSKRKFKVSNVIHVVLIVLLTVLALSLFGSIGTALNGNVKVLNHYYQIGYIDETLELQNYNWAIYTPFYYEVPELKDGVSLGEAIQVDFDDTKVEKIFVHFYDENKRSLGTSELTVNGDNFDDDCTGLDCSYYRISIRYEYDITPIKWYNIGKFSDMVTFSLDKTKLK